MSQAPRLTPVDILNLSFRRSPAGYSVAEVDAFVRRVAGDMEALLTEAAVQRERLSGLERELAQYRAMEVALRDALVMAQQAADETRSSARRQAEAQLQEAQARVTELEAQSHARLEEAQVHLERLRQERRSLIRDVRARLNAHLAWLDEETVAAGLNRPESPPPPFPDRSGSTPPAPEMPPMAPPLEVL
jgi:cell division initiation protein